MWDVNSSFNLINLAFNKLDESSFFDRNLFQTIAGIASTSFTSVGTPTTTYSGVSNQSGIWSQQTVPSSPSFSNVANATTTTWSE